MKENNLIVRKGATLILKVALFVIVGIVVLFCIFVFPSIWKDGPIEFPGLYYVFPPLVLGLYATVIPFFFGLWQILKLLRYIDKGKTFSDESMRALKKIKYAAVIIGIIYLSGLPLLYPIADADDAPGLLLFGFVFACVPITVGICAEVLERLLQNAIDMKNENDLTV